MKLTKLMPLAFATLMAAGGLAGCGGESDAIIVWATAAEEQVLNAVLEQHNASAAEEDKITVKYVAVAEGDTGTEVAKDPSAKSAPELFLVADDHIYNLQSKNIIKVAIKNPTINARPPILGIGFECILLSSFGTSTAPTL